MARANILMLCLLLLLTFSLCACLTSETPDISTSTDAPSIPSPSPTTASSSKNAPSHQTPSASVASDSKPPVSVSTSSTTPAKPSEQSTPSASFATTAPNDAPLPVDPCSHATAYNGVCISCGDRIPLQLTLIVFRDGAWLDTYSYYEADIQAFPIERFANESLHISTFTLFSDYTVTVNGVAIASDFAFRIAPELRAAEYVVSLQTR